ncbi:MAG: FtsB family cell division protein [Gemmobacter sp.]
MARHDARRDNGPALGAALYFMLAFVMGSYFTFAAVQGDHGVFRRVQIEAETRALLAERDRLAASLAAAENLTRRLSDSYLDLDLLDERARDMLGHLRPDEVVIP